MDISKTLRLICTNLKKTMNSMKDTSNLKIANRDAYVEFINRAMSDGHSIYYTKWTIPGYDRNINIKATNLDTMEEMRIIWVEENEEVKQAKIN